MNIKNKMTVWAHRGGANNFNGNSLEAIGNSLQCNYTGVELDVWLHYGQLVLSHDKPSRGKYPLLADVLMSINGQTQIYLELKHADAALGTYELIKKTYAEHLNTVVFASFDVETLRIIRNKSSEARLGLNYRRIDNTFIDIAEELDVDFVAFNWKRVIPNFFNIKQSHEAISAKYLAYTVNTALIAKLMSALGMDGIITDWPEKFTDHRQ